MNRPLRQVALPTLLSLLVGLWAGWVLGSDVPAEPAGTESSQELLPGQAGPLQEIAAELRLLRQALERPAGPAATRSLVPAGDAAGVGDTRAWFEQLDQRLAALADRQAAAAGKIDAAASHDPTRLALPTADFQPTPFPGREEMSTRDFSRRHMFWTYQQVLDAYGLPEQMSTNPHGEHIWAYPHGDTHLEFVFHTGMLSRVEW